MYVENETAVIVSVYIMLVQTIVKLSLGLLRQGPIPHVSADQGSLVVVVVVVWNHTDAFHQFHEAGVNSRLAVGLACLQVKLVGRIFSAVFHASADVQTQLVFCISECKNATTKKIC